MNNTVPFRRRGVAARRALLVATTILTAGIITPAAAQLAAPAPVRQSVDANGVDLFTGAFDADAPAIGMGQGNQGLSYHQLNRGSGWMDSITAALHQSGSVVTVSLGGTTDQFTASGTTYTPSQGNGASLTYSSGVYTYTRTDGTVAHFSAGRSSDTPYYASLGRMTDITQPSGTRLVYAYDSLRYCSRSKLSGEEVCTAHSTAFRITTITSSYGYQLAFTYPDVDTSDADEPDGFVDVVAWSTPSGVTETNAARGGASVSETFGSTNNSGTVSYQVSDPLGRMTSYRMNGNQIAGVTLPGSTSEDATIAYTNGRVSSVATPAGTWNYASSDTNGARTVTVTDPASQNTTYVFDIASTTMTKMTDALGNVSQWQYDGSGRLSLATAPEGNSVQYGYDGRGNVTSMVMHAKPGSGLADITTSAVYPSDCSNAVTCNEPTTTTDARGNTTSYFYDSTHGGVTAVTAPAGANNVQPQTRYSYTAFTDYMGSTVYRQTGSSTCRTQATCSGTADEVVGTTGYGSMSANNLLPVSGSKGAGDGSLTATTAVGYDSIGNMITSTDPLGNVTAYRYDADREMVGTVGPDPDGPGGNWSAAVRTTYDARGRVTLLEQGTAPGQADSDWNNFSSHHQVATVYDTAGRKTQETLQGGGATSALVQYSYDGAGRLDCTALRMNPDTYNSLPGACDLGAQGNYGPDRINRYEYDVLSRVDKAWSGYRTGNAAASLTSYTPDGKTQSVTDENGNLTTYVYDGFDHLAEEHYPNASGGGSSSSDYAVFKYDAAGNITRRYLRRTGNHQDYGYDAMNRLNSVTVPGLNASDHSTSYGYDNLGELTSANDDNNGFVSAGYDALGRRTSEGSRFGGTKTFVYDLDGRRTRVTWQDGFFVTYGYDNAGHMTAAYDNSGTQLFYLSYDDDGRRTALCPNGTMGNQAMCTQYGYDAASRLNVQNLLGNSGASLTFGAYSPAGQIGQRQNSNDVYAFRNVANANTSYSVNGLNQYASVAGNGIGYDPHGNLTSQNGNSYSYDSFNRLGEYNGGQSQGNWLYYDAVGRLNWSNATQTRFDYDGNQLLSELDANGNIARRYVYGPNPDEPVVWYEGSGTGDKRFLAADERGSVIRVQRADGSTLATNSYDEYGVPASGNQGRFGYTGQTWLPELGLWYYKARMYAPNLGRFMQTDPIGYGDGLNWYNYVHSDPLNIIDPSGKYCSISGYEDLEQGDCVDNNGEYTPDITVNGQRYVSDSIGDGNITIPDPSRNGATITLNDVQDQDIVVVARRKSAQPQSIFSWVKTFLCGAPQPSGGGGVDAYAGVGGSITGAGSFNPRNGQISIGFDLGVGVGLGGGGRYSVGKAFGVGSPSAEAAPIASAGLNLNATGVAGPVGATGSYQLIGSNPGDWSAAYTGGAEVSGNVNVSAHVQFNLPALYNLGCPK